MAGKFFSTLRDLRNGATLDDLDSAVGEVVSAVKATGKTGAITLKLTIRPPKKAGNIRYLTVEDEVATKVPKSDRGDTVFFPTADNSLTRQDPTQISLELRAVETVTHDAEGQVLSVQSTQQQGAN
jgi:hypothetical protein